MIHSHYRALVSAKEAAAFFEIWPAGEKRKAARGKLKSGGKAKGEGAERKPKDGSAKPGNVIPMPQAA